MAWYPPLSRKKEFGASRSTFQWQHSINADWMLV
jgi:hypothetical protein